MIIDLRRPVVAVLAGLSGLASAAPDVAAPDVTPEVAVPDPRTIPEPVWPPAWWFDAQSPPAVAVTADHAMVSTANPWASQAALDVLIEGGSAVDAAIAAQLVLNVVEPQSSGIGGGCFILYWPVGDPEPMVVDGRETAPGGATATRFLDDAGLPILYYPDRVTGGLGVGVPGTPAALHLAHQRYGRLPWARLFTAALELASDGFPVSRRLHHAIASEGDRLRRFAASRMVFFDAFDRPLPMGSRLRQPDLARTLRTLADRGPEPFYRGEIAADIAATVQAAMEGPGPVTREDLATYQPVVRRPIRGRYRDFDVFGVGPPSSGGTTTLEILGILEGFGLEDLPPAGAKATHLILEAGKLAFADRDHFVGDPAFVEIPDGLVSPEFAAARRRQIIPDAALSPPVRWGDPGAVDPETSSRDSQETTHLSIVDGHGNMLVMTTTIEMPFGSGMVVPGRGFLLNNELTDFDPVPVDSTGRPVPNRVEPGKRPRSSMSPTILARDGRPVLGIGSPGGSRIIGIVVNVIVGVVDWGLDVQGAINLPRALNRGLPISELEVLFFDDDRLRDLYGVGGTVEALRRMGHVVPEATKPFRAVGGVQGVAVLPDGRRQGGADPRREGVALGY